MHVIKISLRKKIHIYVWRLSLSLSSDLALELDGRAGERRSAKDLSWSVVDRPEEETNNSSEIKLFLGRCACAIIIAIVVSRLVFRTKKNKFFFFFLQNSNFENFFHKRNVFDWFSERVRDWRYDGGVQRKTNSSYFMFYRLSFVLIITTK